MKLFDEYATIIGLIILTFVFVLLFSTPSMIFADTITVVDTELTRASGNAISVRTKMNFGSNEHINQFPKGLGNWTGFDYDTESITASLGADIMLMRAYNRPGSFQPVFFLILQSTNRSSFHPPIVCYPALGYEIEEEGRETVPISGVDWMEDPAFRKSGENMHVNETISVKKLVVVKKSDGELTERRVVLYFYVNRGFTSNTITMIRVSALAPLHGSYDEILEQEKKFMADAFPYMFEFKKDEKLIIHQLMDTGALGWLAIVTLILTPIPIICYPMIVRMSRGVGRRRGGDML